MRLLAASLALVAPLAAQAIIAQPAGLAFPIRVIDFGVGLFPDGTPVSTQFAGLTITHASYFTTTSLNNVQGGFLANDPAATGPDTLRIRFAHPVADVSFVYHQLGTSGPSTIRALLAGNTVDSFPIAWNATQPNNWFGFLETSLDELQIDFVGDFRVDELAFNPIAGAACFPYNGSNVNPPSFGCLTGPVLGEAWQGQLWNLPNTLFTALVFAPAGLGSPVPLLGGELLLNPAQGFVAVVGAQVYSIPIPGDPAFAGAQLACQGVRCDLIGGTPTFVPLNAMVLWLGL